jgi:hypothetical protein
MSYRLHASAAFKTIARVSVKVVKLVEAGSSVYQNSDFDNVS